MADITDESPDQTIQRAIARIAAKKQRQKQKENRPLDYNYPSQRVNVYPPPGVDTNSNDKAEIAPLPVFKPEPETKYRSWEPYLQAPWDVLWCIFSLIARCLCRPAVYSTGCLVLFCILAYMLAACALSWFSNWSTNLVLGTLVRISDGAFHYQSAIRSSISGVVATCYNQLRAGWGGHEWTLPVAIASRLASITSLLGLANHTSMSETHARHRDAKYLVEVPIANLIDVGAQQIQTKRSAYLIHRSVTGNEHLGRALSRYLAASEDPDKSLDDWLAQWGHVALRFDQYAAINDGFLTDIAPRIEALMGKIAFQVELLTQEDSDRRLPPERSWVMTLRDWVMGRGPNYLATLVENHRRMKICLMAVTWVLRKVSEKQQEITESILKDKNQGFNSLTCNLGAQAAIATDHLVRDSNGVNPKELPDLLAWNAYSRAVCMTPAGDFYSSIRKRFRVINKNMRAIEYQIRVLGNMNWAENWSTDHEGFDATNAEIAQVGNAVLAALYCIISDCD